MIVTNANHRQLRPLIPLAGQLSDPHFHRIYAELRFLCSLSDSENGAYDAALENAARHVSNLIAERGHLTASDVEEIEGTLSFLHAEAKQFEYLCVSHAHIDMNWKWGYHETVNVVVDTARTMLSLLKEYPQFIFSQSQASVYAILEEYAPELFAEVCEYIKAGRWEVTASTWVEADKNMSGGESMARHILYTKRYMREKFGIDPDLSLIHI